METAAVQTSETLRDKLIVEHKQLCANLVLLSRFLPTSTFQTLDRGEQSRLRLQEAAMRTYAICLEERIAFHTQEAREGR